MPRLSCQAVGPPLPDDTTINPDDFDVWLGLHRSANNSLTSETRHQSTVVTEILSLLQHTDWRIRMQALSVLPDVITSSTYKQYLPVLNDLLQRDTMSAPLIVFVANTIRRIDEAAGKSLVETAVKMYPGNKYVADAVISNLQGREAAFLQTVRRFIPIRAWLFIDN